MRQKICSECGEMIPAIARNCPKCGCVSNRGKAVDPINPAKAWGIVLFVLGLVGATLVIIKIFNFSVYCYYDPTYDIIDTHFMYKTTFINFSLATFVFLWISAVLLEKKAITAIVAFLVIGGSTFGYMKYQSELERETRLATWKKEQCHIKQREYESRYGIEFTTKETRKAEWEGN